ncbi:Uma2 family endonuclease [Jannaschia sp. LMIT008]|uniref:Uma2 family endonuclease n=1 Tax=Jannaschia maritima TaxID=3032585 RepID=UPI00281236C6|nr:Uma2 family endonuclease [Jannaschia sp. LMIT008]
MKDVETDRMPDVELDWSVVRPAKMNAEMMRALLDAGLLEGRKVELRHGELVEAEPSKILRDVRIDPELRRHGLHPAPVDAAMMDALIDAGTLRDRRYELIQGRFIEMSPGKNLHGTILGEAFVQLYNGAKNGLSLAIDVAVRLDADTIVGPDIIVLPKGLSSDDAGGSDALLIVEISNSTLSQDMKAKARLYAMHGVIDYWVVDIPNRLIHVHRDPSPNGYNSVVARPWTEPVTALNAPDLTLSLPEGFGR